MIWFALATMAGFGVYLGFIRPKLNDFRLIVGFLDQMDAAGEDCWKRVTLWLLGQKTAIFGMVGVFVTTMPGVLEELHAVDFSVFVTPEVALKISGVIMLLMSMFHIYGMVAAAMIEPKKDD